VLWASTLLAPVLLLLGFELAARLFVQGVEVDDAEVLLVGEPTFFERKRVDGVEVYEVVHAEAYRGRAIRIPVEKQPGTFRVFCLGASASAGWPHPASEIYSEYLAAALRHAHPERRIEVFNVSAHAYAAYRVRLIFERVIEFDPDLLILYSGNNEFIEKRRYLTEWHWLQRASSLVGRSQLARLLRRGLVAVLAPQSVLRAEQREHAETGLQSKLEQMAVELRSDPAQFERVKRHYARSIRAMVEEAAQRDVPTLLLTVPVNLRDWRPNASHNGLTGEARKTWESVYDGARSALARGQPRAASELFAEALSLEPEHAETHFLLARARELAGDPALAREDYVRARDLDRNPFRAVSAFNESLREIAAAVPQARLCDAETAFAQASAPHAPGFDLFLDYVHPTKRGNLLLARTVFDCIASAGWLSPAEAPSAFHYVPEPFGAQRAPYDEQSDLRMHVTLLALFGAMHQYEAMVDLARRLEAAGAGDLPLVRPVLAVFPRYLELEEQRLRGEPVSERAWAQAEQALQRFYRREIQTLESS
jgi:tetratricopeptide (TPR) repeat protein